MTDTEKLQKKLDETRATVRALERRNELLVRQFSFYMQYNQQIVPDPEITAKEAT